MVRVWADRYSPRGTKLFYEGSDELELEHNKEYTLKDVSVDNSNIFIVSLEEIPNKTYPLRDFKQEIAFKK